MTLSPPANNLSDRTVIWTIKEGSAGGTITDAGVYTAPLAEGVYHVTATFQANSALSQTTIIVVTATEFTVTGAMCVERSGSTASLLPSGQVFIGGGEDDNYNIDNPAELYDPATGTFHLAGEVSREAHSATVLANGDVLLAGGSPNGNTADLLKAGSGAIQPTGNLTISRFGHTATLLQDGRVLLTGGYTFDIQKPTQTAEIYDSASGKFTPAGDITTPRGNNSAALLPNGRVLIVGGAAGAELYDPATNSFFPAPTVSANRCSASATTLANGRVLIAGGTDCSNTILDTAEIYDSSTGQSTPTGKLVAAQAYASATLLPDGRVVLVGGTVANLSQFFDPATGSFTFGPHLIHPASGNVTLLSDGSLFVVASKYAEIYR
jgi:WD40 repeat protein